MMRMLKVLVVDDEAQLAELVCRALTKAGHQAVKAGDGRAAITALETRGAFDAALVDIIMPEKEGIETIIEMRRRWPETPVIAMSGGGRISPDEFLILARSFGAEHALKKPFALSAAVDLVQDLCRDPGPPTLN
jgi:DNA-binding response OmpR family regulator